MVTDWVNYYVISGTRPKLLPLPVRIRNLVFWLTDVKLEVSLAVIHEN